MAYNRLNHLKKVLAIQDIWQEFGRYGKGYSDVWVFKNKVKDQYWISMSTFYKYLEIPAKKQIKEIEARQVECTRQAAECAKQAKLFE
jgi:hypothetical protein